MIRLGTGLNLVCLLIVMGMSQQAVAKSCESNDDCPDGMACEEFSIPTIGIEQVACICPEDDPDCDACADVEPAEPSEPQVESICVPKSCSADSECGDGNICLTVGNENCDSPKTAPPTLPVDAEPAPEPEPEGAPASGKADEVEDDCTPGEIKVCAPKYLGACESSTDCGEGFTCEDFEVCQCSSTGSTGSAGSSSSSSSGSADTPPAPTPDDGDDEDVPSGDGKADEATDEDENCDCEVVGKRCEPIETACTTDTDCIEGWTCEAANEGAVSICAETPDGESDCEEETQETKSICWPPNAKAWMEGLSSSDADFGEAVSLAAESGSKGSSNDDNAAIAPGPEPGDSDSESSSGCQSGEGPGSLFPMLLLLLGLVVFRRKQFV